MTAVEPDHAPARRSFGRRAILIGANLLLYFFLIRWAIKNIDFHVLLADLGRISPGAVAVSVTGNVVLLLLYGLRMSRLLGRRFFVALTVVNLGYALNLVLPFRIGDVTKIYLGRRMFGIRISQMVSATFAEKLIDLGSLIVLGGIIVAFSSSHFVNAGTLAPVALLVAAVICAILAFRMFLPRFVNLTPKRGGIRRGIIALHRQLNSYKSTTVYIATAGIWCLSIGVSYYSFNAYISGLHMGLLDAAAILVITALAVAVPSAPGSIGLYEAGIVAYLQQKGVDAEAALAAASIFHLANTLPPALMTAVLLWLAPKQGKTD
jgi:glycosyltransferase 2 family protein